MSGSSVDHAGKSESFQSFLVLSIIPTRKTLITTVGQFPLSQIPRHLPALQDITSWMMLWSCTHSLSESIYTTHECWQDIRVHMHKHTWAHNNTNIHSIHTKWARPSQSYPHHSESFAARHGRVMYIFTAFRMDQSRRNAAPSVEAVKLNYFKQFCFTPLTASSTTDTPHYTFFSPPTTFTDLKLHYIWQLEVRK